jgi:hypothetical protein
VWAGLCAPEGASQIIGLRRFTAGITPVIIPADSHSPSGTAAQGVGVAPQQ